MTADVQRLTVQFDGSPLQPRGTVYAIRSYEESGFVFKPQGPLDESPPYRLARNGGGTGIFPENGTAYLQLGAGNSLEVLPANTQPFRAVAVDLAEYSDVFANQPATVAFRGTKADNTTTDVTFTTDGILNQSERSDFETFRFPKSFNGLVRLEVLNTLFSLDNLVLETGRGATDTPDLQAPVVRIRGPLRRTTRLGFFVLAGTVTDDFGVARVQVRTGNGPWIRVSGNEQGWQHLFPLKARVNVFRVRAVDAAGNVSRSIWVLIRSLKKSSYLPR